MKITITGTGYVGLVSGACLAEVGNDVLCFDVDAAKHRLMRAGGAVNFESKLNQSIDHLLDLIFTGRI